MFRYKEPQFEKKRLLRIEMLEQLRDYPRDYLKIRYQDYSDGILCGCGICWEDGVLTVAPGIMRHGGQFYLMETPYSLECRADDRMRYVKVRFLEETREAGMLCAGTDILLEETKPDPECETELCRFRLQKGARLRSVYENFEDYSTQFDTVNVIHAPYASEGEHTLHPAILKCFARELLEHGESDAWDISFAMHIMAGEGAVAKECICLYLKAKSGAPGDTGGNETLYRGLLNVLKNQESSGRMRGHGGCRTKQIVLL
ncbi:hypothetical protein D3Z50_12130 [Clostridiaceae bacterium]|jgi:hypothetical protein|nr:hypothetical protein [Clostridiaceae bacterium]